MNNVGVDLLGLNGARQGEVANEFIDNRLNVGFMRPFYAKNPKTGRMGAYVTVCQGDPKNPASYRTFPIQTNATLRREEWKALDDALLTITRENLGGVEDLRSKGLVYNLGNAMGTTMLEWHDLGDSGSATISMDGVTRHKNDRPNFQHNYIPIPIIHSDYEINVRELYASRKMGNGLDTINAENAARRCAETLEQMLFLPTSVYSFGEKDARGRNTIYSYTNHPDRMIMALGTNWDDLADTSTETIGEVIVNKIIAGKQQMINNRFYGPYQIYIPTNYETVLDKDYNAENKSTIRDRILAIAGISGIKVIPTLPADNVLMIQMTSNVVRLINGFGLTNVQWASEGGMVNNFKVMTIQVPQIRSDQEGRCGVLHMS